MTALVCVLAALMVLGFVAWFFGIGGRDTGVTTAVADGAEVAGTLKGAHKPTSRLTGHNPGSDPRREWRLLSPDQVAEARERIAAGVPKSAVARELGVSRQTLYSALAERQEHAA